MTYQREFTTRLRVAVVGVGKHSYRNILPCLHHLPVMLVAVCDINLALAEQTAKEYGCKAYASAEEMYASEQLDAVFLCVSPAHHPALAKQAFEAGVHVWMEKPAAMRAYEVEELLEKRGDLVAVVGFKKAFMPSTAKAIEIVNSAEYGNLKSMLAVYPMTIPENGREVLEGRHYVNLLANGVHPLSMLMAVGGEVEAVTTHRAIHGHGLCLLQFKNGVVGNFHFASGPFPIEQYRFFGERWNLEIDNSLRVTLQRGIPHEYNKTWNYIPEGTDTGAIVWEPQNHLGTLENKSLFTQGTYSEMKYFCDCVLEKKPAEQGTLEFALHLMKVYEAALLSEGKTIHLENG